MYHSKKEKIISHKFSRGENETQLQLPKTPTYLFFPSGILEPQIFSLEELSRTIPIITTTMNLSFVTLALAATALGVNADSTKNLRGDRKLWSHGYNEHLGVCTGATCSMWGDPHMVTCDGLTYDCQGIGLFTVMQNHMYNIQANFVDVGEREHVMIQGWGLTHGASITNDIMIEYKLDDDVPVMQFGFGDISGFEDNPPSEEGCIPMMTFEPVDMGWENDGQRSVEPDVMSCRERCESNPECTQFSWWADGGCHLNNDDAVMKPSNPSWARAVVGTLDSDCGKREEVDITLEGSNGEEDMKGEIDGCPLLMYINGTLIDLSDVTPTQNAFLWGERGDDHFVELINDKSIRIVHNIDPEGPQPKYTEINLIQMGEGPGELWSCHWNFYICLPNFHQDQFMTGGLGLLGTPNGNTQDDWMDRDGVTLPLEHWTATRHSDMLDYCVNNWCVTQEESLMTYHGDTAFEDHKCEQVDSIDWREDNEFCVLSAEDIEFQCRDMPPVMMHGCQLDCCYGGCNHMEETLIEIEDMTTLSEDPEDVLFEFEPCTNSEKLDTSSTVCPGAEVVKLLKSNGDEPLPEDDIFYDIEFGSGTVGFRINNPFEAGSTVYVKHDKKVISDFMAPVCDGEELTAAGCDDDFRLEVACHDFDGIAPFAVINVYFASVAVSPLNEQASIDRCCEPEEFAPGVGVVEYTFEIQCGCPGEIAQ